MEYVEGEVLRGPMPLDEARRGARQIAERASLSAHRARDSYLRPRGPSAAPPDGKRFLVITTPQAEAEATNPVTVVLNWLAGVKK